MKLLRRAAHPGPHPWISAATVLAAGLALLACAPAEEAGDEAAAAEGEPMAAAGGATAAGGGTQEAPACRFTASGEELTRRASPPDSASLRLGDATVKLCYGAPSVRGREIVGGLVPYGRPWRMGANEPTTLHLPFAAEVGGVRLEPGSYSLYAIPGESEWTIVLNGATERWGVPIDDAVRSHDVGSFSVQPQALEEPVERMSIELEAADGDAARMVLEWETTRLSCPIRRVEG